MSVETISIRILRARRASPALPVMAALLVVVAASCATAQAETYADVTLELTTGLSECASVDPDTVTIYTEGRDPRAVEWTVTNKSSSQAWVMEYASDKPGASAASFGSSYTIPCGTTDSVQSDLATQTGTWVYRVKVYDCVNGEPSGSPVCTVDPEVIIQDPPG